MNSRLTRPRDQRIIAGVCAGIARYIKWDPAIFRLVFVLVSIFSAAFPGFLVYIILWIVMPEEY
ncbi:MAG: PspC domain-containing protein [Candidatus Cyclobacteriaceae bacterium M2_1C_046]